MRPRRVLVTGVSRYLGGRLAAVLAADPEVETVIGVDTAAPETDLGRTEFVRADIRNPLIAKVIASTGIDTVLHLGLIATPHGAGGRTAMKEINVIGTMQLLAACQKAPSVRRLVLRSTSAVYGSSSRDPALFTEEMEPRGLPRGGYGKDAIEVEGYVRGFGRRRPDVTVTVLRLANVISPKVDSPLTRYLSLPVVPTLLGHDPRVQLVHSGDAVEVLRLAALEEHAGTYNVGGEGVLLLSQAIRRAGRAALPVPSPAVSVTSELLRRTRLVDFSAEQVTFLEHGRVVDTTRLREQFGYLLKYTTLEAYDDFVRGRRFTKVVDPDVLLAAERRVLGLVSQRRSPVVSGGSRRA